MDPQGKTADAYVIEDERDKLRICLTDLKCRMLFPITLNLFFQLRHLLQGRKKIILFIVVNKEPELTGGVITDANANIDPTTSQRSCKYADEF